MPVAAAPKIDQRRVDDLLDVLVKNIPQYWPEWKETVPKERRDILALANDSHDFGMVFLKLTARMGEIIIEQFNRVPEKNFLAFLDLLGIDLLPPKSARAPLTFSLAEKAPVDVSVPKGTKVGVANMEDVVFETEEDLLVSRALPKRVYSLSPEQDRYADIGGLLAGVGPEGKVIFRDPQPPTWPLIEHVLYVGHSQLFALAADADEQVKITIGLSSGSLGQLEWQYSGGDDWTLALPKPTSDTIVKLDVSGIREAKVKGYDKNGKDVERSSYWIRAKTTQPLPTDSTILPEISSLTAEVNITKSDLMPKLAFFNNMPIDLTKDFFPFGERPKFNDTFYIASREAFSKKEAKVTLKVRHSDIPVTLKPDPSRPIKLTWEYWNGIAWRKIGTSSNEMTLIPNSADYNSNLVDNTKAFTTFPGTPSTLITFDCPTDWQQREINGQENYWLCMRIVEGDYGKEADYLQTTSDALKTTLTRAQLTTTQEDLITQFLTQKGLLDTARYIPATFKPPSLKSLTVSYSYSYKVEKSDLTILSVNDFVFEDVGNRASFQPFVRSAELFPTLYLGFDSDKTKPVQGTPLSLYSQVIQPRYGQEQSTGVTTPIGSPPIVVWRYWDGNEWARLAVEDESHNFTEGGRVRFIGPATLAERTLFGERLLWIKASVEAGAYAISPRLQGIFLNTVWARHGVTLVDQILGSSNGEPNQLFSFSKSPLLEGQVIEISEPTLPSEAETQKIISEEGQDAIRTVKDDAGNITEVWVRWHEVNTFTLSGPVDRHYLVDRLKGRLLFGDGVRGLIPHPGKDNIKASVYRSGGGAIGNCPEGTITELKTTFPSIAAVVNHQASAGGSNQERLDGVMTRGPRHIKSRDRAVTVEDYEWLAYQASGEVAKTRCLPMAKMGPSSPVLNSPGWVTLILVPAGEEDQPVPTVGLIKTVKDYLAERSLATMKEQIDVIGPAYTPISVEATVVPKRIEESKAVEKKVFENLKTFLHPLKGGPDGEGWEFGRDVYLSEIAAVIQGTEGVDHVQEIILKVDGKAVQGKIEIPQNGLPSSGRHTVTSVGK